MGWDSAIQLAVQTWTDVTPTNFSFVYQEGDSNVVRYVTPNDDTKLAGTAAGPDTGYEWAYTKINPNFLWDINSPPSAGTYSLLNVMTHEFGHWLYLDDLYYSNCSDATMYYSVGLGEDTLSIFDENGMNFQYP